MMMESNRSLPPDTIAFRGTRPSADEAAPYYHRYIANVPDGDICATLESQLAEVSALLGTISEQQSLFRYEPGKWSVRGVLTHINDSERVFSFRAFWFARGFDSPLPGYDQDIGVATANADDRPWPQLIDEFRDLRVSTLDLLRNLPADGWRRRGIASDNPVSVRGLAWIIAGHAMHHVTILRERYLRS